MVLDANNGHTTFNVRMSAKKIVKSKVHRDHHQSSIRVPSSDNIGLEKGNTNTNQSHEFAT